MGMKEVDHRVGNEAMILVGKIEQRIFLIRG
jgi:hypothetical protein